MPLIPEVPRTLVLRSLRYLADLRWGWKADIFHAMRHYVFAWQAIALLMGFGLLPPLARGAGAKGDMAKAAGARNLLVSLVLMIARVLFYATVHYAANAGIAVFPEGFEESYASGLICLLLVAGAAWFLLAGLFGSAGARGLGWLALPWWSYVCVIAATFATLALGLPLPGIFEPLHNWQDLAIRPFVAVNATTAAACACLAAGALAKKGERAGWRLFAAAPLAALSQLGDALFLLDASSQMLSTPLIYLGYFGALGILASEGKAERGLGRENLAGSARGRDLGAAWAREAKLDAEEASLLVLILAGKANKEIAPELGLGLSAEKHRVQKLFAKLGVATRKELLARAASAPDQIE